MQIVYYISAHGYGHGVRSCEVANAIREEEPDAQVSVVSGLPGPFLTTRLGGRAELRHESFDVGMVQLDSVRIDPEASLQAVESLLGRWEERVETEAKRLESIGADVVVCDIPAIPIEAAARVGIPSVALGNFAWDWIYGPYADADVRWTPAVERFRDAYSRCGLLLRLPFAEPMSAFPEREDMPLSGAPGTDRRLEIASRTGADRTKRWVLLSFTSLSWDEAALSRAESVPETEYFTVRPLAWERTGFHAVAPEEFAFRDVLASCDVVVSKPGYGIVSECIVNRKPLIHAVRTGFPEYPILVDAIERYLRQVLLSERDLYEGRLGPALDAIVTAAEPDGRPALGGAAVAARRILDMARRASLGS
ncbi:MAG: hypothetical protein R3E97_13635 [Candidatus Eisenbacteria bacterium]